MANKRTSPLRFLFVLLLMLVVVIGAYGFMLYTSLSKVRSTAASADTAYHECLTQIENNQYEDALVSIRTVATDVESIDTELQNWQWNIAAQLPVINEDVNCARQSADIANKLANEALMPMIEDAGALFDGISTGNALETIPDALAKVPDLYATVTDARKVVATCKTNADALPTSHFDELNSMAETVKTATYEAEETFASFDVIFDTIDGLSGLVSGTTDGQSTTTDDQQTDTTTNEGLPTNGNQTTSSTTTNEGLPTTSETV